MQKERQNEPRAPAEGCKRVGITGPGISLRHLRLIIVNRFQQFVLFHLHAAQHSATVLKLKMMKKKLCRFCHHFCHSAQRSAIPPTPKNLCRQHCWLAPYANVPARAFTVPAYSDILMLPCNENMNNGKTYEFFVHIARHLRGRDLTLSSSLMMMHSSTQTITSGQCNGCQQKGSTTGLRTLKTNT